jgi:hypothetical protein
MEKQKLLREGKITQEVYQLTFKLFTDALKS